MTTTSDAANKDGATKPCEGIKGYANNFLNKLIEGGKYSVVWKERVKKGDSEYGIFIGTGMFQTNETESGEDLAMFMCLVKKKKDGSLSRTGKATGMGKYFYPQFIVPYAKAFDVGKALIALSGNKEVVAAAQDAVPDAAEMTRRKTEEMARKLGYIK